MPPLHSSPLRTIFHEKLHLTYERHEFDNWVVWAGNMAVLLDGERCDPTLVRVAVGPGRPIPRVRVQVELFVAAVEARAVRPGDVDVRLWTDANQRGFVDEDGNFQNDPGRYLPMRLVGDAAGVPRPVGNNLVFESAEFPIHTTGVFNFAVEVSADIYPVGDPHKEWITINDMADNQDGVLVVSPAWLQECPAIVEVCARKAGAQLPEGRFHSGNFAWLTRELDRLPADIVYLVPFFKPGFFDLYTGEDVRKGTLGSVYAVADFFQVDPELVTPPEEADLKALVEEGLLQDGDLRDLVAPARWPQVGRAVDLAGLSAAEALAAVGRETLVQLIGRAELCALTRRAHELGKRVIFDLVLMQTSRDNPLIREHPDWYVLDENGRPSIHSIAWLVYSDVALFALVFNKPLQNYLLGLAPYWIERCDFDGVRIDASQTVDRPFLKQIKNRINAVRPEALVLGETLCPLDQALDIPVDMIYALLVDFHRDVENAAPLIRFFEEMHARLAPRTLALAYFENHDSPRATRVWREKFTERLVQDPEASRYWQELSCGASTKKDERPLLMALLKNLQASLLNATAGAVPGSNLAGGLELGSDWGEETRTDFENETLLHPELREQEPRATLVRAYQLLHQQRTEWPEVCTGQVYYHRNEFAGGDPDDRILGYGRYTGEGALLVLHSFDLSRWCPVEYDFAYLPWKVKEVQVLFDTYEVFRVSPPGGDEPRQERTAAGWTFRVFPLQSKVVRLLG